MKKKRIMVVWSKFSNDVILRYKKCHISTSLDGYTDDVPGNQA